MSNKASNKFTNGMSCVVCYEDMNSNYIVCPVDSCKTPICVECAVIYFRYMKEDNSLPKCTNCEAIYHLSVIKKVKDLLPSYLECLKHYFLSKPNEKIRARMEKEEILNKMREEKLIFISKNLPKAVLLTANICMSKKMKNIDKSRKEVVEKELTMGIGPCFRMSCRGSLNQNYVCSLCETIFCKECEKKKNLQHTCKKEDVDSVQDMKNVTRCPNCNVPIFKYEGCQMMTCAICKHSFNFVTGGSADHGSHNKSVKLKEHQRMSSLYREELQKKGLLEFVIKVEDMARCPVPNEDTMIKYIIILRKYKDDKKIIYDLAKEYEKYVTSEQKYKLYITAMVEIEELISSSEIDQSKLETIMGKL